LQITLGDYSNITQRFTLVSKAEILLVFESQNNDQSLKIKPLVDQMKDLMKSELNIITDELRMRLDEVT
jgi:hypothetical protein